MIADRFVVIAGTVIDRLVMEDPTLSWKAKGVYTAYCQLQQLKGIAAPTIEELRSINGSGYESVASAMRELRSLNVIGSPSSAGKPQRPGFIYLAHAQSTNWYKIGLSRNPQKRIKQINEISPVNVTLVCCFAVPRMGDAENALHNRFAHKRVKSEWFELEPADIEYIKSVGGVA